MTSGSLPNRIAMVLVATALACSLPGPARADLCKERVPNPNAHPLPNGCGSIDFPVPSKLGGIDITTACNQHDTCYDTCNDTKHQCDRGLLRDIRALCDANAAPRSKAHADCISGAKSYFHGVTLFGTSAYEDAQKGACTCCGRHEHVCGDVCCAGPCRHKQCKGCDGLGTTCSGDGAGSCCSKDESICGPFARCCIDGTGACTSDGACCTGHCDQLDRHCCAGPGDSCSGPGECCPASELTCGVAGRCCLASGGSCTKNEDCCGGRCDPATKTCCGANGSTCAGGGDCCGGACDATTCCTDHLRACGADGDCCAGAGDICPSGVCCRAAGAACNTTADCCFAGGCQQGACCLAAGLFCTSGAECCGRACGSDGRCTGFTVVPLTSPSVHCVQQVGGMDAQGDVVGVADFTSLPFFGGPVSGLNAFVWRNGTFTPLGDFPGFDDTNSYPSGTGCSGDGPSAAAGISPNGTLLVGSGWVGVNGPLADRAIAAAEWSGAGAPVSLGSLCAPMPMNAPVSNAYAVNAAGDVVGTSRTQSYCDGDIGNGIVPNAAFLRHGGTMAAIAAAGGAGGLASGAIEAIAVNASDRVVITDDNAGAMGLLPSAYLWQPSSGASVFPGTLTALPVFPLGSASLGVPALPSSSLGATSLGTSFVLNDANLVVGVGLPVTDGFQPAYSVNAGAAVMLTPVNGLPQGAANGVNDHGDVVGSSFDPASGTQVATLWSGTGGTPSTTGTDINTLLPPGADITLYEAVGIDDAGDILAYGAAGGIFEVVELRTHADNTP